MAAKPLWNFPSVANRYAEEGRQLQQLTGPERAERVLQLIEASQELLADAPLRQQVREYRDLERKVRRERWKALFDRMVK